MLKIILFIALFVYIGIKIGRHSKASWVDRVDNIGRNDLPKK